MSLVLIPVSLSIPNKGDHHCKVLVCSSRVLICKYKQIYIYIYIYDLSLHTYFPTFFHLGAVSTSRDRLLLRGCIPS